MLLLDTLPSRSIFTHALESQGHPLDIVDSTYNTLALLTPNTHLCFSPVHMHLLPARTDDDNDAPVPEHIHKMLRELTLTAQRAAAAAMCGSVLAGPGSESDEYGDVAFWLGRGPYGEIGRVLETLGLTKWAAETATETKIDIARVSNRVLLPEPEPGPVPDTDRDTDTKVAGSASSPALTRDLLHQTLEGLQLQLQDVSSYRVHANTDTARATVLFLLVGRLDGSADWAGLLGVGVWSDS